MKKKEYILFFANSHHCCHGDPITARCYHGDATSFPAKFDHETVKYSRVVMNYMKKCRKIKSDLLPLGTKDQKNAPKSQKKKETNLYNFDDFSLNNNFLYHLKAQFISGLYPRKKRLEGLSAKKAGRAVSKKGWKEYQQKKAGRNVSKKRLEGMSEKKYWKECQQKRLEGLSAKKGWKGYQQKKGWKECQKKRLEGMSAKKAGRNVSKKKAGRNVSKKRLEGMSAKKGWK